MSEPNEFSLIFLHIPKTAGTTLRTIIENIYDKDEISFVYPGNSTYLDLEDFTSLSDDRKAKIRFICEHLDFGVHKFMPKPCKYITVFRDPVEYTTSLFHHLTRKANAKADKHVAAVQSRFRHEEMTIEDFVTKTSCPDADNIHTRLLSGVKCGFGQCKSSMLDTAKKNLREHFAAVGFTERFDESVVLFQKTLGWPTPFYVKQNISKNRSDKTELPQETLDIIRRQNEFDFELYRFAQDMFNEQVEKQGPSFQQDVADFKIANRFAEELLQNQQARGLQKQIDDLKNSWSWRMTAPMRKALAIISRMK